MPLGTALRPLKAEDDVVSPRAHARAAGVSFARVAITFCLALALSSVPIFSTVLPPLLDYPNHLARMHVVAALDGSPCCSK